MHVQPLPCAKRERRGDPTILYSQRILQLLALTMTITLRCLHYITKSLSLNLVSIFFSCESGVLIVSSYFSTFCFCFFTLLYRNIGRYLCFCDIRVLGFPLTPFCWLLFRVPDLTCKKVICNLEVCVVMICNR